MPANSLRLRDGRSLAFELFGDKNGAPVFFFHGFPGSRLQAGLVSKQAQNFGLCLVAFDRPGFGKSSPHPSRTVVGVARDVADLANELGHERFGLLGVSCGGPYAMACAKELSTRVIHLGLLGGVGPMDIPAIRQGQLIPLRIMFSLARINRWLVSPLLAIDRVMFLSNPRKAVDSLSKLLSIPDQIMLKEHPELVDTFAEGLAEAYRQGISGPATEARLVALPHGYSLGDIKIPTDVFQAGQDGHVPQRMGEFVSQNIPDASYHLLDEEGHLSIVINAFERYATRFLAALRHVEDEV
ncbi:MAG: alpha/beta hydrolase [Sideroxydans sp.]|nr:alpha/beta hydrolase [Sideroxydans sp.]